MGVERNIKSRCKLCVLRSLHHMQTINQMQQNLFGAHSGQNLNHKITEEGGSLYNDMHRLSLANANASNPTK